MTVSVTTSSNLNQPEVLSRAFKEFTTSHELAFLMGTGEDSAIQMKYKDGKGSGDKIYFSLIESHATSTVIDGSTNLAGNETSMVLRDFSVTLDYRRKAVAMEQRRLVDLRTPVEIFDAIRPCILDVLARKTRDAILATAKVTATPHRTRVLAGAVDSNFNATFATMLANVDATDDKLSVNMINLALDKARNVPDASNSLSSREIRPINFKLENGAMIREYVLLVDAIGAKQLLADTDFTALRDDQRKNAISMPYFNGHDYLGEVSGVMVYRVNALSNLVESSAGAASINVSHALLLGAQAFAYAVGLAGEFVVGEGATDTDYGRDYKIAFNTIVGEGMITFSDGSTDIENGLIHIYHSGSY